MRVVRSGAARQGALLREKEIQGLRAVIEQHLVRERELDGLLNQLRDQALAAEQQREDAQRQLYMAHRGVSELAGQLQSQQGRLDTARNRIGRIDDELAQLAEALDAGQQQAREARLRVEDAVSRMAELETARQALEAERRQLTDTREAARTAARESRDAAHALALALESQRVQVVALAQALARMDGQRGQLDSRLGDLAAQLADGDAPVATLEQERQAALSERVRTERELAQARSALEDIDNELRRFEQTRHQRDAQALEQREAIGQRKLDQQALVLKAEGFSAAVVEAGFVLDDAVANLLIGSDPSCDFYLPHDTVSPIHARLWVDLEGAVLLGGEVPVLPCPARNDIAATRNRTTLGPIGHHVHATERPVLRQGWRCGRNGRRDQRRSPSSRRSRRSRRRCR
mgnify:CR=1 FL=1